MAEEVSKTSLFDFDSANRLKYYPIVYHDNYDISFCYLELLHHFDTHKWSKVHRLLHQHFQEQNKDFATISPTRQLTTAELNLVHTTNFLDKLHGSPAMIARAAEVWFLALLPNFIVQWLVVSPVEWQTAGSVLAAHQALRTGSAVNLGGGFHHASGANAEGFCLVADITLIIKHLWKQYDKNMKFMIVDLDAHQGNGYEMDKVVFRPGLNAKVFIFDMYNKDIYPMDEFVKGVINRRLEITSSKSGDDYINLLKRHLGPDLAKFKPDLVIYNAGTDVLDGDPLGKLHLTSKHVIQRDHYVFAQCKKNRVPIVMLTSGGYQKNNASIIAKSIINLIDKKFIKEIDLR